jgi:uncharacterized protein (DUF58 family)
MPATTEPQPIASQSADLLTGDFMAKLDRLDILSRKILAGKMQGDRRSKRRGQSVEFADYRPYVAGDDLRRIDWNLYARLDRLFLRLFMEEEDLSISILLDATRSMDYGDPNKMLYAKRLAAALGYIGLVNQSRVSLFSFAQGSADQLTGLRGRQPVPRMLDFLSRQQCAGPGSLEAVCKRFAMTHHNKGVVLLVSDFFDKGDFTSAVRYLMGGRFDVYALHVLAPQEIDPAKAGLVGDLRLHDVEDNDLTEVSISPALLKRYKANLQAYCAHLRQQCVKRGIAYLVSDTSVPFEHLVLKHLRERGLLG